MLRLYLPDQAEPRHKPRLGGLSGSARLIAVTNAVAECLVEIMGPFFWGALIMTFFMR
jgi:hypothetical protein